jgi:hypothetical protein
VAAFLASEAACVTGPTYFVAGGLTYWPDTNVLITRFLHPDGRALGGGAS